MDSLPMGGLVAEMKIVGFGDSFILGSELLFADGRRAWPARAAKTLGIEYETVAMAGVGNEAIAQQIFEYFCTNDHNNTLAVVNWTWHMRWDFWINKHRVWVGLGPTCVPEKLYALVDQPAAQEMIRFYNQYIEPNEVMNKQRSLMAIYAAQRYLYCNNIKNIQTYMDTNIWDTSDDRLKHYLAYRDPEWPVIKNADEIMTLPESIKNECERAYLQSQSSPCIKMLQDLTRPHLENFDGYDFLTWSRLKGFAISDLLHPLQQAHDAAAEYWLPRYRDMLSCQI